MIEIKPSVVVLQQTTPEQTLLTLESLGRIPYKSEGNIKEGSADPFIRRLVERNHTAMIEFSDLTFVVTTDRGVTHELVRHRLASFAQESTRYCNYGKKGDVRFIRPFFFREGSEELSFWSWAARTSEKNYMDILELGRTPQEARSVLINSTAATIAIKMNMREMRHFLELRTAPGAHGQMRQIAIPLLDYCRKSFPALFEDMFDVANSLLSSEGLDLKFNKFELFREDLADLYIVNDPRDLQDEAKWTKWVIGYREEGK